MRKILALFTVGVILATYVQPVAASEKNENVQWLSDDGQVIESIFYDENGKEIINYADFPIVVDEAPVTETSVSKGLGIFRLQEDTITYEWSLTPVNDYSYLWAYSHASRPIDRMVVIVSGYRDNGHYIGESVEQSLDGWTVASLSAYVKPKDFGLNYKVGSGVSTHSFYCEGHEDVIRTLTWRK